MLLSRVAERLYWAARYLERAEGTARIVREHSNVIVDLPLSVTPAWEPLLAITGGREGFDERYDSSRRDVDRVVPRRRLVEPRQRPHRASPRRARTCARAARSFPRRRGTPSTTCTSTARPRRRRRRRSGATGRGSSSRSSPSTSGCSASSRSTMSRDEAYEMLRLGRHIERGDMIDQVLDVRAGLLLGERPERRRAYDELQWSSVLRSLSALQMYNRRSAVGDGAPEVIRFILGEATFPRSVAYCLAGVQSAPGSCR